MVILLTTGLAANYMDLCLPCITHRGGTRALTARRRSGE